MTTHRATLRQLIADGLYIVDEQAVAAAILARASVKARVAHAEFRTTPAPIPVRSFRRDPHARSFRLERKPR